MDQKIVIDRFSPEHKQTIGTFYLLENDFIIKSWFSLELPWLNNQNFISCIPPGIYTAIKHESPKFGPSLWIQDVEGRSEILVHYSNHYWNLKGCVAIGEDLTDLDKDGNVDVTDSKASIRQLMSLIKGDSIQIEIKQAA